MQCGKLRAGLMFAFTMRCGDPGLGEAPGAPIPQCRSTCLLGPWGPGGRRERKALRNAPLGALQREASQRRGPAIPAGLVTTQAQVEPSWSHAVKSVSCVAAQGPTLPDA